MIYIINFLVLAVDAFFERFIKSKVFLYISSILLVCFAGFRGFNVGPDTPVYVSFYEETLAKIGNSYFEPGYHFLEHFCSFLGLSATFF